MLVGCAVKVIYRCDIFCTCCLYGSLHGNPKHTNFLSVVVKILWMNNSCRDTFHSKGSECLLTIVFTLLYFRYTCFYFVLLFFLSCQMDSMESVPSSVINSALKGYDKTSLPEVHDNEITQALMPGQRPPYLLNQAILVSPPSYDESYAQATYHDLQTRPFLDPNQEIHGMCWRIKYA